MNIKPSFCASFYLCTKLKISFFPKICKKFQTKCLSAFHPQLGWFFLFKKCLIYGSDIMYFSLLRCSGLILEILHYMSKHLHTDFLSLLIRILRWLRLSFRVNIYSSIIHNGMETTITNIKNEFFQIWNFAFGQKSVFAP